MAELEPGHPDELVQTFRNWLREANSPMGALPEGVDPVEWAVRRFIDIWKADARNAIDGVEKNLSRAIALCDSKSPLEEIKRQVELARQTLQEDLRGHLGLYDWNNE
jgi:hypothetical protein